MNRTEIKWETEQKGNKTLIIMKKLKKKKKKSAHECIQGNAKKSGSKNIQTR